jgi:choline dehydrogenase-like flavoprotein
MALRQVRTIREVLAQPVIARYIDHERLPGASARSDAEIMAYVRQYASCDYHPVGTCRMGTGQDAVVDPRLRVHGMRSLRVIDSSIMPRLTSGNTMAPTMMIAEKGADLVRDDA